MEDNTVRDDQADDSADDKSEDERQNESDNKGSAERTRVIESE